MASSVIAANPSQHHMDRIDAARALLGVSPPDSDPSQLSSTSFGSLSYRRPDSSPTTAQTYSRPLQSSSSPKNVTFEKPAINGLDALAALASKEQEANEDQEAPTQALVSSDTNEASCLSSSSSSSEEEDSDAMPPPPPRGRRRAMSNPEGMEKWAPYPAASRRHFVLPASILEEELAEASAAMEAHERKTPKLEEEDSTENAAPVSGLMSAEEQANLTPDELLKRARSRLLEDLSEGSLNGEKGVLTLPHSLSKYKEVYNKNGRIGIYTPAERSAIIARFNSKRSRRVWNKKIRYNCRKNLADRRMRVKGRFVKRSTEEEARAVAQTTKVDVKEESEDPDEEMPDVSDPDAGFCPTEDLPYRRTRRHTIT